MFIENYTSYSKFNIEGRRCFQNFLLHILFFQIFKSSSYCLNNKCSKCAIFSLNCFFNIFNHIVWKTDAFRCCRGNGWNFKLSHTITNTIIYNTDNTVCITIEMLLCRDCNAIVTQIVLLYGISYSNAKQTANTMFAVCFVIALFLFSFALQHWLLRNISVLLKR